MEQTVQVDMERGTDVRSGVSSAKNYKKVE